MKKLLLLLLLAPIIVYSQRSTLSREEWRKAFVQDCSATIDKDTTNTKFHRIFHEYCECAGEKVINKFSDREMDELTGTMKRGNTAAQVETIHARLTQIIQPCLEEMQEKQKNINRNGQH